MKSIELKNVGQRISVLGHQVLAELLFTQEQTTTITNETNRIHIIKPTEWTKKVDGEKHSVVTDAGKIHLLRVLNIGDNVKGIDIGDIIRITPELPERIIDMLLSNILNNDVAVISTMSIIAVIKQNINKPDTITETANEGKCSSN